MEKCLKMEKCIAFYIRKNLIVLTLGVNVPLTPPVNLSLNNDKILTE